MNPIEKLNASVWAKLGVSSIHGVGVIAIRNISKGQRVYAFPHIDKPIEKLVCDDFAGLHPEIVKLIEQRWPLAFKGEAFISPNDDARLLSFMNHSSTPNYDDWTDRALRFIPMGTELTEDYGEYAPVDK